MSNVQKIEGVRAGVVALVDFVQYQKQFPQRDRAAEQVTLSEITTVLVEKFVLLLGGDSAAIPIRRYQFYESLQTARAGLTRLLIPGRR